MLSTAAEDSTEDEAGQLAAVEHLPAQSHREIAAERMHPRTEAWLLEQHRCHKAHDRAHDADDHQRDGIGDELRTICEPHEHKRKSGG